MTLQASAVAVEQLPETLNVKQGRLFFSELKSCMDNDRPCIVLDCSKVRQMDRSGVHLLLCCLEEAMKRNGDVKLAEVAAGARAALELTGADRIFEMFDTNADAINSFRRLPVDASSHLCGPGSSYLTSENAA
ncbi:MAG: STAS domain-containing protein [Terracidiphilus sp.]|jgi:anti-anti-sigma factor